MNKPLARKGNIVVQKIKDETLVYDLDSNTAFCLNKTSTAIWELCDGSRSAAKIAEELGLNLRVSIDEELVKLAIDQFGKEQLLDNSSELMFSHLSRRDVLRKIGFASAIALPAISVIVAPTVSMAQSCTAPGPSSCAAATDCCSGNCQSASNQCCVAGAANGAWNPGHVFCIPNAGVVCSDFQINCCSVSTSLIGPSDGRCGDPTNVMCECNPFP